ncbi:hypothetical protein JCM10212_001971 [Sporobolomyces blumeae]
MAARSRQGPDALAPASASSSSKTRRSPWDPYAPLPPSTKRKLDPRDNLKVKPYLEALEIPTGAADERLSGKLQQLDPPAGKVSDQRKAELAKKDAEKEKRAAKRKRDGDCGLVGRRKRAAMGKAAATSVNYAAVLPVYHLWLGYMAELLGLPIAVPPPTPSPQSRTSADDAPASVVKTPLPTFPTRHEALPPTVQDMQLNAVSMQTKLVKAEFVGSVLAVKRAKNPSLVGLSGIVLQETQGTFKLVTSKSVLKVVPKENTVFTLTLPLASSPGSPSTDRSLTLDIFGDSFAYRSAERIGRKWKAGTSAGGIELV